MKVCIVLGTRPELIKFTPIIEALQSKSKIDLCIINTGQHTDLLNVLPHIEFKENLRWQPYGSLNSNLAGMLPQLNMVLTRHSPDLVLVQGDTTSALAGALAAANLQLKVGHIEAGLRTYDSRSPFPEENYRRLISAITDYHFCISEQSKKNLEQEYIGGQIHVVGSTAIEMVLKTQDPITDRNIVLTAHRRENIESGNLEKYVLGIVSFLEKYPDVGCTWFTHPNPQVQEIAKRVGHPKLAKYIATTHDVFIKYCRWAWAICSDSGGIQEENTILQKPLFILRDTTERPEVLETYNMRIVTPESMFYWLEDLYERPEKYMVGNYPYGVGHASQQIACIIASIGE